MANQTGNPIREPIRPRMVLTADMLNRIVDMLITRISGGPGINVRRFGQGIIIEKKSNGSV